MVWAKSLQCGNETALSHLWRYGFLTQWGIHSFILSPVQKKKKKEEAFKGILWPQQGKHNNSNHIWPTHVPSFFCVHISNMQLTVCLQGRARYHLPFCAVGGQFDTSIKKKMSKTSQISLFFFLLGLGMPVCEGLGWHWVRLCCRSKKVEVPHTCWKLMTEGKRVPVRCGDLCQVLSTGDDRRCWDHPEKGEEQGEAPFGLTERLTASYQLLLPPTCSASWTMAVCFLTAVKKRLRVLTPIASQLCSREFSTVTVEYRSLMVVITVNTHPAATIQGSSRVAASPSCHRVRGAYTSRSMAGRCTRHVEGIIIRIWCNASRLFPLTAL